MKTNTMAIITLAMVKSIMKVLELCSLFDLKRILMLMITKIRTGMMHVVIVGWNIWKQSNQKSTQIWKYLEENSLAMCELKMMENTYLRNEQEL